MDRPSFLLIELPVFPKGIKSLGLPLLASFLNDAFRVKIVDLNYADWSNYRSQIPPLDSYTYVGLKVSSQNIEYAKEVTGYCKADNDQIKVIWGGEYPTLMPENSLEFADAVVAKRVEGCIDELLPDLVSGHLKPRYDGGSDFNGQQRMPLFSLSQADNLYARYIGQPIETSTGCDRYCKFCMVHTMQPGRKFKQLNLLIEELSEAKGKFLNVLDYNIGMSKEHLINVCRAFEQSGITGWMGEMCLDTLDDEELLQALQKSRCKVIYCGLESLSEEGLKSVNKHKTNNPATYKAIIRKVQSYGINIASGLIVGLDGTDIKTFKTTLDFFHNVGIEYVKITFLTYNPGTYFHESMKKHGKYVTQEHRKYDGNHLTFLAEGLDENELYAGTEFFIREFYSLTNIVKRGFNAHLTLLRKIELVLFNLSYRQTYFYWLQQGVLQRDSKGFRNLIEDAYRPSPSVRIGEFLLENIRKVSYLRRHG